MAKKNSEFIPEYKKKKLKGIEIKLREDKEKYSQKQYLQIYKGYDFLENIMVVRNYIQKYYDIDWQCLELLLKLMGMRVFTVKDYTDLPKDYSYSRFNNMRDRGFIALLQENNSVEKSLFCLSVKGQNICTNFYAMLSGEKKIPEDSRHNLMAKRDATAFDKKKMNLIEKLNQLPVKEHFKTLF